MCHDDIFTFGPSQLDKGLAGRTTMGCYILHGSHWGESWHCKFLLSNCKKHMNKDPGIEHKLCNLQSWDCHQFSINKLPIRAVLHTTAPPCDLHLCMSPHRTWLLHPENHWLDHLRPVTTRLVAVELGHWNQVREGTTRKKVKIDHPHSWFTMRNCEIEFNTWEAQPSTTRHDKNNDSHVSTDRVSSPIAMVKMAWTQSFLEFSLHASKPLVFPAGMMCLTSRIYQT